ncbi:SEA/GATOR complex protein SEA2/WDR24, partial [Tremellales sp. Uapishka_1]
MNRLTNAFSATLGSTASDTSSLHQVRESPRIDSPTESQFSSNPHSQIYDDPRASHSVLEPKWESHLRPMLLRTRSSEAPTSRASTPRPIHPVADRGVRVNLMSESGNGHDNGSGTRKGKVTSPSTGGQRLNSMAKGPEGRYVVGGGQYLKVIQISSTDSGSATPMPQSTDIIMPSRTKLKNEIAWGSGGTRISHVVNLWKGSWAVGKGVNDVDWGTGAFSNKILTANPAGNYLIFDVEKGKLEREVNGGHTRPMNCLKMSQIPAYAHLLITGGTEGQVRIWDLREKDRTNRQPYKHNAAVTSLCWSPDEAHQFLVGTENGAIYRYDYRHQSQALARMPGAHMDKAVMDLKWKAEGGDAGSGWLASAGADRAVRIWDMGEIWDKNKKTWPVHTLHTCYPLRRVAWRPNHSTELAIVSLTQPIVQIENTAPQQDEENTLLEIWDVRRHYIAKYALPSQDGTAVNVAWGGDDMSLVAAFQNGGFAQLDLKNRILPLQSVPRQVMSWSSKGELAFAIDKFKQGEIPFDDPKSEFQSHWDKVGWKSKNIQDDAYEPLQAVGVLPLADSDEEEFAYIANHYRLDGDSPEHLCEWNREIAEICGRDDDARLWMFLKSLIEECNILPDKRQPKDELSQLFDLAPSALAGSPELVTAIPLKRIEIQRKASTVYEDDDYSTSPSSSSSLSSSTSPVKSRFLSFLLPDTTPPTPQSTLPVKDLSQSAIVSSKSLLRSLAKKKSTESSDEEMTDDPDYPDPYGILPEIQEENSKPATNASTNNTSNRSSPIPKLGDNDKLSRNSPMHLNGRNSPNKLTKSVFAELDAKDWEGYRKERGRYLLEWWNGYVEDSQRAKLEMGYFAGQENMSL